MLRDAPDIRMTEATGYPSETNWPRCPVCGEECETIYYGKWMDIVGCDMCLETRNAWEWAEEEAS